MNTVPVHAVAQPGVLYVVATTTTGTEAALRVASALATERGARLMLVVPQIGPTAGSEPLRSSTWFGAQYQRMAHHLDPRVEVTVSVGSSVMDALRQRIPLCTLAIVGGRHRWWWPQPEERIAAALRRSGRRALFVPETGVAGAIAAALSHRDIPPGPLAFY